jgi:integrase
MQKRIGKRSIDALRVGQFIVDDNPRGFIARRLKSGTVTYSYLYRDKATGKQRWLGLGVQGDITPDQARKKALKAAGQIQDGGEPVSAAAAAAKRRQAAGITVDAVLDDFLARYVRKGSNGQSGGLRSADEITRVFKVYVRPRLGNKAIHELARSDIVKLLDEIEDGGAPVMADRTLAHLRKALNWYATRDEKFNTPVVKGMARTKPNERARTRILDDQEIRDLWTALDDLRAGQAPACFPSFVRALFLTATRLRMASDMAWDEIKDRDWTVPGTRNKGGREHVVPLTDGVIDLLGERRKGFVFSSDGGKTAFKGFSKAKAALDAKLAEIRKAAGHKPMPHFTFHDLRRTARSLMSRAGVPADHAERTLAHVIAGVRGVYDRHEYRAEKLDALEKLGALVERILHPDAKVVGFPRRASRRRKAP